MGLGDEEWDERLCNLCSFPSFWYHSFFGGLWLVTSWQKNGFHYLLFLTCSRGEAT